jgi:hypothetical protein
MNRDTCAERFVRVRCGRPGFWGYHLGLIAGRVGRPMVWKFEEMEDDSRELVRSRRDCLSRTEFALHSPEEFAQVGAGIERRGAWRGFGSPGSRTIRPDVLSASLEMGCGPRHV